MSETPQSVLEAWIGMGDRPTDAEMSLVTLERVREAIRALLDLVRVQYEANEEMTRLLKAAEAERDALKLKRREQFNRWGVQIRYEDQEQSLLAVMQLVAERDALRAEVARLTLLCLDLVDPKLDTAPLPTSQPARAIEVCKRAAEPPREGKP
jgi:hypothetical protein